MKKVLITLATLVLAATTLASCGRKDDSKIEVIDCEGKTVYATIVDGKLCYYNGGTPIEYCEKCHAIMHERGTYIFTMGNTEVKGCKKCVDEAAEEFYKEHNIKFN